MADGVTNVPDINQILLQQQAAGMNRGGKPAFLFGVIPLECNVGGGMSMQSAAPLGKNIATLFQGTGKAGGLGDKFLQAFQGAAEDFRKCAQNANVMYSGNVTNGTPDSGLGRAIGGGMGGNDIAMS